MSGRSFPGIMRSMVSGGTRPTSGGDDSAAAHVAAPSASPSLQNILFSRSAIVAEEKRAMIPGASIASSLTVDPRSEGPADISVVVTPDATDLIISSTERRLIVLTIDLPDLKQSVPSVAVHMTGTADSRTVVTPVLRAKADKRQFIARMRGCMLDLKPWTFTEAAYLDLGSHAGAQLSLSLEFHASSVHLSLSEFRVW